MKIRERLYPLRHYIMYWMSPLVSLSAAIIYGSRDPWVNAIIVSVSMIYWWLLAMLTEETMRYEDRRYDEIRRGKMIMRHEEGKRE